MQAWVSAVKVCSQTCAAGFLASYQSQEAAVKLYLKSIYSTGRENGISQKALELVWSKEFHFAGKESQSSPWHTHFSSVNFLEEFQKAK